MEADLEKEVKDALEELVVNYNKLYSAAENLYFAGNWKREASPLSLALFAESDVKLWEDLRDALELHPGSAREAGVNG